MRALALAMLLPACSWVFMETKSETWKPTHEPRCTSTRGWALVDTLAALGHLASLVTLIVVSDEATAPALAGGVTNVFGFGLHTWSAIDGFSWSSDCDVARALRDRTVDDAVGRPAR